MSKIDPKHGLGTLVNHAGEGLDPRHAHVTPIYQSSIFSFPDAETGASIFKGETPGYIYTRLGNPNLDQYASKIAVLEGLDLLRARPETPVEELVTGIVFASGMAAITAAILGRVKSGQTIIAQEAIYSATYNFLCDLASQCSIQVVWLSDVSLPSWEAAFRQHPGAALAYAETPANPLMLLVDLAGVAQIAHRRQAWLMVDNTFASPYCQRPLTLGTDVVVHSTTKFLSGHGLIIGGAAVTTHVDFGRGELYRMFKILGGVPSPFDAWLGNIGLKTFEVRMQRICANARQLASFLETDRRVAQVYYPGLESHPQYELACRQMIDPGGMITFELKGGFTAGAYMMNHVRVATLAVSLGNVDTLISHPASMTHSNVPPEARRQMGISDGLVRFSVGIENIEDIINDLDQAMQ
jgi:methionine-gamma-lyase